MHQIIGPSMRSTLYNGDIVILDKVSYRFIEIKRHMEDKNMDDKKILTPEEKMTAMSEFIENAKKK